MAALRRERGARRGAPPPLDSPADSSSHGQEAGCWRRRAAGPAVAPDADPAAASLAPLLLRSQDKPPASRPSDQHRRPRPGDCQRQQAASRAGDLRGRACKDSAGHHALRPAGCPHPQWRWTAASQAPKSASRHRNPRLQARLLNDRKPSTDAERESARVSEVRVRVRVRVRIRVRFGLG